MGNERAPSVECARLLAAGSRSIRLGEPTQIDWRDPNMPVYRNYKMRDGTTKEFVDPDYERRYREHLVQMAEQPNWRNDPTYNMRRKRK